LEQISGIAFAYAERDIGEEGFVIVLVGTFLIGISEGGTFNLVTVSMSTLSTFENVVSCKLLVSCDVSKVLSSREEATGLFSELLRVCNRAETLVGFKVSLSISTSAFFLSYFTSFFGR